MKPRALSSLCRWPDVGRAQAASPSSHQRETGGRRLPFKSRISGKFDSFSSARPSTRIDRLAVGDVGDIAFVG